MIIKLLSLFVEIKPHTQYVRLCMIANRPTTYDFISPRPRDPLLVTERQMDCRTNFIMLGNLNVILGSKYQSNESGHNIKTHLWRVCVGGHRHCIPGVKFSGSWWELGSHTSCSSSHTLHTGSHVSHAGFYTLLSSSHTSIYSSQTNVQLCNYSYTLNRLNSQCV